MALDQYEATRVGYGGYPKRLTEDDMQDGEFEVTTVMDYAKVAWDEHEAEQRRRKSGPPPGQIPHLVWTGYRRPESSS